jgi:hypothetical protein
VLPCRDYCYSLKPCGISESPNLESLATVALQTYEIADLAGCEEIQSVHLAEALHLRPPEVDAQHDVMGQYMNLVKRGKGSFWSKL